MSSSEKIVSGAEYQHDFSFTQSDVERFAEVTGDRNPIHLDAAYAAGTMFKQPIMQFALVTLTALNFMRPMAIYLIHFCITAPLNVLIAMEMILKE